MLKLKIKLRHVAYLYLYFTQTFHIIVYFDAFISHSLTLLATYLAYMHHLSCLLIP